MKIKTISIIGGTGKMGKMFASALKEKGFRVILAGRNTKIDSKRAAMLGDIVIVCVPIRYTEGVIKEIAPYVRTDALLTDFTSVKVKPCEAMKKYSKCEVTGGHPVFGPKVDLKGQSFVICPVRGSYYTRIYVRILKSLGLRVIVMKPEEHDRQMAFIQCLTQISNFTYGLSLKNLGFNLDKGKRLASPAFVLRFSALMKPLTQNPELYSDIETENPYAKEAVEEYAKALNRIAKAIQSGNKEELETIIKDLQRYFKVRLRR